MVMRHVAGAPASALDRVYAADDSGISARPLPGSRVAPPQRFYHLHHRLVVAQMSGRRLGDTAARFAGAFERQLRGVAGGDAWTPVPDLHAWLGGVVFTASVEALCGTRIFAVNPALARDFRAFYAAVPTLLRGLPRFLAPGAHAARERMLENLRRWNRAAREAPLEAAGPGWDEWWGCEFVKERKRLYGRMAGGVDEDGMAADDLILLFV